MAARSRPSAAARRESPRSAAPPQIDPSLGEAWWSLSDLKTVRFDDADIATMEAGLRQEDVARKDRYYLHFALGKAYETRRDHAASFTIMPRATAFTARSSIPMPTASPIM